MKKHFQLLYDFFIIGLFTIGGGYAMIPLMRETFVKTRNYLTEDEFLEMLAISQITPGPIAINMATFIGYREGGLLGSTFATVGVVLPSFIVILLISMFFANLTQIPQVKKFFIGILTGVVGEIIYITFDIFKKAKKTILYILILLLSLVELFVLKINPIYVILIGGALGIVFGKFFEDKNGASS
ncbi:chromate transporter [Caldisericum exile]|uniref:Chromate transport protein n=1 Tax=Caldisericum exile (strain DSM 21853 / NBRC 104410 / AZM16c01) TaxID=511051 RepID=A0A7U6GD97_CALEA|nr:chromate transporter [Caldisericum exile]BAL80293.1 putative chromate transport protein [Caldisericum exile AZM16c01]